jgi:nicotinamidase-related amidase
MTKRALIVVDLQNDYFASGSDALIAPRAIASKRVRTIRTPAVPRARTTSSGKDAHPLYSMMYRPAPLQSVQ